MTPEQLWNGESVGDLVANNCDANEIEFVVTYADVNDKPQGFKNEEDANAWMEAEKTFGDYEMNLLSIDEFIS
jgi:hypothetical protein